MKKITTTLIFIICITISWSQDAQIIYNNSVVSEDTVEVVSEDSESVLGYNDKFYLKNTSNAQVNVSFERELIEMIVPQAYQNATFTESVYLDQLGFFPALVDIFQTPGSLGHILIPNDSVYYKDVFDLSSDGRVTGVIFKTKMVMVNKATNERLDSVWINYSWQDSVLSVPNQDIEVLELKMFPNPATDVLTIKSNDTKITSLEIRDVFGRLVWSEKILNVSTGHQVKVRHFKAGVYFVTLTSSQGFRNTRRLIIK